LVEELCLLIAGEMTNDQFDNAKPEYCADLGVIACWEFGYSLYSSDLLFPYRLRGRLLPRRRRVKLPTEQSCSSSQTWNTNGRRSEEGLNLSSACGRRVSISVSAW
jgi:hypothetical protein